MPDKPWVSIVTPVYNGWEFLEECAHNVFLQKGLEKGAWEWLIGINGHGESGGDALVTARGLEGRALPPGCSIRVWNLPHAQGKVEALNLLAAEARGNWVAVLDCDDLWAPTKLAAQKEVLERLQVTQPAAAANLGVIGTHCWYFGDMVGPGPVLPCGWIPRESVRESNPLINSSCLVRRELAHWENRFHGLDDYDMWIRLTLAGWLFYNVDERLVFHRIHTSSAFNGKGRQDVEGLLAYYKNANEVTKATTTVVTAYYPIPSKFPVENYVSWIQEFWPKTECPLVCFVDPNSVASFQEVFAERKGPTRVIGLPFQGLSAFTRLPRGIWTDAYEKDTEKEIHSPELYAIWYEKKEFVRRAIELDPFGSDTFVWCDAGIGRYPEWIPFIATTFPRAGLIPRGSVLVLQINPFQEGDRPGFFRGDGNRMGGGILASDRAGWSAWSKAYDVMLLRLHKEGGFIGKDQAIMASICLESPGIATLIQPFQALDPIQQWFSLLFYLAGVNVV